MLSIANLAGWTELQRDNPTLASRLLLKNAEDYALFLAKSLDAPSKRNLAISKENIGMWTCIYDHCTTSHISVNIQLKQICICTICTKLIKTNYVILETKYICNS